MTTDDLPDVVTLHALLEEGNVTRAAQRLGITQSSMSHRLASLREHFRDPLFVRQGNTLVPTPRAAALAEPLAERLRELRALTAPTAAFDPKRAKLSFDVLLPDLLTPLGAGLTERLSKSAPGVTLRLRPLSPSLARTLAAEAPSVALVPSHFLEPGLVSKVMGDIRFAVVGRVGHPVFHKKLTVDAWLAFPHVVVRTGNDGANLLEAHIGKKGLTRRVGLEVPGFLAGLLALTTTNLLMNAPVPLVNHTLKVMKLESAAPPIELPTVRFALAWHERFQKDDAHRWLRELVTQVVREVFVTRG